MRTRLTYANVAATIAAVAALGGAGYAVGAVRAQSTGLVGRDGIIHGCVGVKGALSVVARGVTCPVGTTTLNWSQTFNGRYTSPAGTSSLSITNAGVTLQTAGQRLTMPASG